MSARPKVIRNSKGMLRSTLAESVQRWQEHFNHVLNTTGQYLLATINSLPSYGFHDDLANVPTMDDVQGALCHIAGNKASGSNGILPEMVKVCSSDLLECLVKVFVSVWDSRNILQDWKDALLIPVPKKGDFSLCDIWCGISLLEVVGKVSAKIIQGRLQVVVENVVVDA